MCATEGAELNVLFLSTLGQENNVGTAGLQCKPLQVETLTYYCVAGYSIFKTCHFEHLTRFLYMSFRAVGVSRIRVSE